MSCGAETEALALLGSLTTGISFTLPVIDLDDSIYDTPGDATSALYDPITRFSNDSLTTGEPDGPGTFDALMRGFKGHLRAEYDANRITGADYSKAYTELSIGAMQSSVAFLIGRESSFWASQQAQIAAIIARVALVSEKVKVYALRFQALTAKSEYGLTTMKISSESMNYCLSKYNLENILPAQRGNILMDTSLKSSTNENVQNDTTIKSYTRSDILPSQKNLAVTQNLLVDAQKENVMNDTTIKQYTLSAVLPAQVALTGKQGDLYTQQVISYERDVEAKIAKLFGDIWTVQKTMDEGLSVPGALNNSGVDAVFAALRNNAGLG